MEIFHQYLDGHPELKASNAPAVFKLYTLEMTEAEREEAYAASLEAYLESGKTHAIFDEMTSSNTIDYVNLPPEEDYSYMNEPEED